MQILITFFILFTYAVPNGPPQNISASALSSTAINLTWRPPVSSMQNGVIRNYYINITVEDTAQQLFFTSNVTSLTINGLHPFYTYTYMMAAVTIGLGAYSSTDTVITLEDGKKN